MFFFYIYENNNIVICMFATGVWACSQELDLYETLVLFVIYFVLKMFKNIDFYIKTKCTRGVVVFSPEQECNLVTVLALYD